MIRFRPGLRADVEAVVALLADDILGRSRERADLAHYLDAFDAMQGEPGNLLVVGERDGHVLACYQLTVISGLSLSATRRAQIEGVRVAAELRGQGVGAALIADAEARARQAGATLMQFTTNAARDDAHRFYTRMGFAPSHIGFKKTL
ncbi:Ribosomal protein S18 acetylase RimI [Paracoccus isoporae]|uniref:Ribosomal protein S18 acetylase RimI n=1 Tax=Paracoccus isoporae TaxID=591205 RepID=A0A1G6WDT4_9RHOB|nr:GNAT family N-acetyltransferase [Paracoccus isoporae]SDD63991.1 Ribosomal protein S18 acetylase RimI [Paracoccus isoporae]